MITQEKIAYSADEIKAMIKTCEKYNKALERAKDMLAYKEVCQEDMEYLFPELAESKSKDEMIRQCLIEHIKCNKDLNWSLFQWFKPDTIISWLEKQCKQKFSNIPSRETILAIWELGNDWKELTNGSISTEYGTQLEYIQKHWQESSYYIWEEVTNESNRTNDW